VSAGPATAALPQRLGRYEVVSLLGRGHGRDKGHDKGRKKD
jgi:hypothetical protein